jgi:hypothetical protein
MSLAVFNSAAFLTAGQLAVAANAVIEIRREDTSALASIFSNEAGTAAITNPSAFADSSGRFTFYAAGIQRGYSVLVTSGAESFTLHNVAIGTTGQIDCNGLTNLPAIAAKGDAWRGTGASTVATESVGAAGTIPQSRTAATTGVAWISPLTKLIHGFAYRPSVGSPTNLNELDIDAGGAMDATGAYWIAVSSGYVKQIDAAWAVGTNRGSLDTGAVGNSDYYVWAIARSDTGVTDFLTSLSSTAPTMPANYDFKRLIGWFKRAGGTIVAFTTKEIEGGGLLLLWTTPTLDVNLINTLTTARRTDAAKVPLGFSVDAILRIAVDDAASNFFAWVGCPDHADVALTGGLVNSNFTVVAGVSQYVERTIPTSAAGLIAAEATIATVDSYAFSTVGFTMSRRN